MEVLEEDELVTLLEMVETISVLEGVRVPLSSSANVDAMIEEPEVVITSAVVVS